MPRKILEISVAVFFITASCLMVYSVVSMKPLITAAIHFLDDSRAIVRETQKAIEATANAQIRMVDSAENISRSMNNLLDTSSALIQETKTAMGEARESQEQLMHSAEDVQTVLYEMAIGIAVIAMAEERMISPTDAEDLIVQSINTIEKRSERMGKIARLVNDYRLQQSRR